MEGWGCANDDASCRVARNLLDTVKRTFWPAVECAEVGNANAPIVENPARLYSTDPYKTPAYRTDMRIFLVCLSVFIRVYPCLSVSIALGAFGRLVSHAAVETFEHASEFSEHGEGVDRSIDSSLSIDLNPSEVPNARFR